MSSDSIKFFLFANGPLADPMAIRPYINKEDILIAVDGGLRHIVSLDLTPNLIIGDLDSADPQLVQDFSDQNIEVRQYPEEKDQTDLELAISAALDMQATKIRVAGALGDRIDQTLGNIFLLTKSTLSEIDIRLIEADKEIFLIRKSTRIDGGPGQRVSLLPLLGPVRGIRTNGLKFQLDNETLYPDQTRGISNEMTTDSAFVEIQQGLLLCIHEFSTDAP